MLSVMGVGYCWGWARKGKLMSMILGLIGNCIESSLPIISPSMVSILPKTSTNQFS